MSLRQLEVGSNQQHDSVVAVAVVRTHQPGPSAGGEALPSLPPPQAAQLEMEQLARAFLTGDTPAHNQYRMADAYCRIELVRIARACVQQRLPARVYW